MSPKIILNFFFSFVLSFLFIWTAGYFFKDSLQVWTYSDALGKYIFQPESRHVFRSEGNGESYYGHYGINGYKDISENSNQKMVIWGDSFVEAWQVDDSTKLWSVLNGLFVKEGFNSISAVSIGAGESSVADYAVGIRNYMKIISNIYTHFIVITDFKDTLPDRQKDNKKASFRSSPFRIENSTGQPGFQGVKRFFDKLGLYFAWDPLKGIIDHRFHFLPAKACAMTSEVSIEYNEEMYKDAWEYLFKYLKRQSQNTPVVFVYCPEVPKIDKGQIVFVDKNESQKKLFIKVAYDNDIPVIDLTESFAANYKATGNFHCGFQNSRPSLGHFNETGNRLVAQAISKYINKNFSEHAIYKN
jgi:hypothetical protein